MRWIKRTILIVLLLFLSIMIIKEYSTIEIYPTNKIYPTNEIYPTKYGDYDSKFCLPVTESIDAPTERTSYCPQKAIVTVEQGGRLGNQMWEYASVWVIAKKSGHEPYVPRCIIMELEKVFENLTIPPLSYIAHCPVYKRLVTPSADKLLHTNEDILLQKFAQMPEYVIPELHEVLKQFKFKQILLDESKRILHSISRNVTQALYVAVHVRRGDYIHYLRSKRQSQAVEPQYFLSIMEYFRNKYENNTVLFVVVSDDTEWCLKNLQRGHDVFVESTSNPGQDLALMAACNHSIIDYGTFGTWGAAMAGGETFLYKNVSGGVEIQMSQMIPNWHAVD